MFFYKEILQDYQNLVPVAGAPEFLAAISKSIKKFAICSNANRHDLNLVLDKLDGGRLQSYFQFTVSVDDVSQGKPEPEGYLKAAQLLTVEPRACLVVEDSKSGIRAGKSAGMTVAGLTTSHGPEILQEADYIADSYAEIESWLKTGNKIQPG